MVKNLRKTLAFLLALSMLTGMLGTAAFAAEGGETAPETPVESVLPADEGNGNTAETPAEEVTETPAVTEEPAESVEPTEEPKADEAENSEPVGEEEPVADEDIAPVAEVDEPELTEAQKIQAAIDAAEDGVETTITMTADITGMTTAEIITVPAGKVVVLDMAGHEITAADDFAGRPIVNNGTLTVTGNGTIDSSASRTGYGAIRNDGVLTIENGTYIGSVYGDGAAIRNGIGSDLTVNGGYFAATCGIYNAGHAVLYKGEFVTLACSGCGTPYAYALNNRDENGVAGTMEILPAHDSDVVVYGTQGALASVGGAEVYVKGGTFYTEPCTNNHKGNTFYAVYVSGKAGAPATCVIDGGKFSTTGANACIYVNNTNPQDNGGEPGQGILEINGGSFDNGENGAKLITFTGINDSILAISGGTFAKDVSDYCVPGTKWDETTHGIVADIQEGTVATVGSVAYNSLEAAFAAVNAVPGTETVTLTILKDCGPTANEQMKITRDNVVVQGVEGTEVTINCAGYSCSGQAGVLVSGDNVTVKNLKITTDGSNGNVSVLKATKVNNNGTTLVTGLVLEDLTLTTTAGHGLNLHGVKDAVVTNVTAAGSKCGLALANAVGVTVSGSKLTGNWGAVGMMYKENDPAYENHVSLSLGAGNTYTGVIYADANGQDEVTLESDQTANIIGAKVVGSEKLTTEMPVKIEREDGVIYYADLQTAIAAAGNGDTVMVLKDVTLTGAINPGKEITIEGVNKEDGSKPVISGAKGLFSFTKASGTLKNLELQATGNTWYIYHSAGEQTGEVKLTVSGCEFTMAEGVTAVGNLVMTEGTKTKTPVVFTGNTVKAHSRAAFAGPGDNTVITDNVIDLMGEQYANGGRTSVIGLTATAETGDVVITGNVFQNVNRVLAVDNAPNMPADKLIFQNNKFIDCRWAFELKGSDEREFNINYNYYSFNGQVSEPRIEDADGEAGHFADENAYTGEGVVNDVYYTTEAMERTLTLTPATVSIRVGGTATLAAVSNTMDGTVTWTSSDPAVARVSESGEVTGVSAGSAVITAAMGDTTATCTVAVTQTTSSGGSSRPSQPEENLGDNDTPLVERPFLFTDVLERDWFYSDVKTMFNKGLILGVTADSFAPYAPSTRAVVATLLYRMAGSPDVSGLEQAFEDVPEKCWYRDAAVWALNNGVFGGYGDGTFRGTQVITREELAAVLNRYAEAQGIEIDAAAELDTFTDAEEVSAWAVENMKWAVSAGLINGRDDRLAARESANRAELATLLVRFDKLLSADTEETE